MSVSLARPARCFCPLALLAAVCVCARAGAEGASGGGTTRGVVASAGAGLLTLEGGEVFRLDSVETVAFEGVRSLGLEELRTGLKVEVDYRNGRGGAAPLAVWVEAGQSAEPSAERKVGARGADVAAEAAGRRADR